LSSSGRAHALVDSLGTSSLQPYRSIRDFRGFGLPAEPCRRSRDHPEMNEADCRRDGHASQIP
jgi:hypothetical protein